MGKLHTFKKISRTKGFTIIEVLIVLAIAGLILLIVFLAVPTLQRQARNRQTTNEAFLTLAAAHEIMSNDPNFDPSVNVAFPPANFCVGTTNVPGSCGYTTPPLGGHMRIWQVNRTPNIIIVYIMPTNCVGCHPSFPDTNIAVIGKGLKCSVPDGSETLPVIPAGPRTAIVLAYATEGGGGTRVAHCLDA